MPGFASVPPSLRSLRFWSRACFGLAVIPAIWCAYQYWDFAQWARTRDAQGGFVCGTGFVMLVLACSAVSAMCVAAGSVLGIASYLRRRWPRPG